MINARELRLKNLVFESNNVVCIEGIKTDNDIDLSVFPEDDHSRWWTQEPNNIDPIPLTPEWLQKLGFEKRVLNGIRIGSYDTIDWDVEYYIDNILLLKQLSQQYDRFQSANKPYRFIQYVHQLQNLYFALTGTELTVRQ